MTTPNDEGGLGLKNLQVYNHTCALKLLWLLLFRTESIWVAWIHQNVIQNKKNWAIKQNEAQTWIFKQILKQKIVPVSGSELYLVMRMTVFIIYT